LFRNSLSSSEVTSMAVSTEELQKRLLKYFESRLTSRKHIKISDPVRITSGWETDIYSFNTEYQVDDRLGSDELILRLYPGNGAEAKASKEFHAMTQLHGIGFPVPRVCQLELDKSILGRPFVIMEKVNGRLMGEALNESENTGKTMLRLFCKMFVDLHALDVTPFVSNTRIVSDPSVYETNDPYNCVNRLLSDFRHRMISLYR
jgi:aminoglycoside phosphotransferase (APT) family kinase protein